MFNQFTSVFPRIVGIDIWYFNMVSSVEVYIFFVGGKLTRNMGGCPAHLEISPTRGLLSHVFFQTSAAGGGFPEF